MLDIKKKSALSITPEINHRDVTSRTYQPANEIMARIYRSPTFRINNFDRRNMLGQHFFFSSAYDQSHGCANINHATGEKFHKGRRHHAKDERRSFSRKLVLTSFFCYFRFLLAAARTSNQGETFFFFLVPGGAPVIYRNDAPTFRRRDAR